MWIGSAKNNETKPLRFESYKEPIKSLGINHTNHTNVKTTKTLSFFFFFIKIYKMDIKRNIWQTRDLTLFGQKCWLRLWAYLN